MVSGDEEGLSPDPSLMGKEHQRLQAPHASFLRIHIRLFDYLLYYSCVQLRFANFYLQL